MGDSVAAAARSAGSMAIFIIDTWGLRPKLYAFACFTG